MQLNSVVHSGMRRGRKRKLAKLASQILAGEIRLGSWEGPFKSGCQYPMFYAHVDHEQNIKPLTPQDCHVLSKALGAHRRDGRVVSQLKVAERYPSPADESTERITVDG